MAEEQDGEDGLNEEMEIHSNESVIDEDEEDEHVNTTEDHIKMMKDAWSKYQTPKLKNLRWIVQKSYSPGQALEIHVNSSLSKNIFLVREAMTITKKYSNTEISTLMRSLCQT